MNMQKEKILVVSRDHDFKQLLTESNVRQYDPVADKYLDATITEAKDYLFQHIVKGDTGDGIPNILSSENIFMERDENGKQKKRQTPISKKKLELWRNMEPSEFCPDDAAMRRYERNKLMIDLSLVPDEYVSAINDEFERGATITHNNNIAKYIANVNASAAEFRDGMFSLDSMDFYDDSVVQLNPFEQRKLDLLNEIGK